MILYLVQVSIDREIADQWQRWMQDIHIPDVVATGCFQNAWMARMAESDTEARRAYRMVYLAKSKDSLDRYQAEFAPALQMDHTERFEGRFDASRELLDVIETY